MGQHQVGAVAAISPEPDATETTTLPAAQEQPVNLATEKRCGAVDLGVAWQAHHIAPAVPAVEPAQEFSTGESAIGQQRDRPEPSQKPIGFFQADGDRCADAGTGVFERLPQQRNGPAMADHREHHHADAVPEHGGIKSQMQGVAWVLPALDRPENQRAVKAFRIYPAVVQPALATPLPAGSQAVPQWQPGLPVIETDRLAQEQPGHHPTQEHQMTLVTGRAVLTDKGDLVQLAAGRGNPRGIGLV